MAIPFRETMTNSSSPVVAWTLTTSSPFLRLRAMIPSRLDESYSRKRVFLTIPFFVAMSR
jgi:hypothetical protein